MMDVKGNAGRLRLLLHPDRLDFVCVALVPVAYPAHVVKVAGRERGRERERAPAPGREAHA